MKKLLMVVFMMFFGIASYADTINLHWLNDDGTIYQNSSCTVDGDLVVPTTPPTKYGYTFAGWEISPITPIEYLESTGTQWIDTGVVLNGYSSAEADFQFTSSQPAMGHNFIAGARLPGPTQAFYFAGYSSGKSFASGYYNLVNETIPSDLNRHVFKRTKNIIYFDNVLVMTNDLVYFVTPGNCYLFSINQNGSAYLNGQIRLWSFKIWNENDTLVRDFIPVLDPSGTPCMYDRVEKKFYYNAGTGDFIAGPVLNE